jgi:putative Mg2+ transporter-C (MgtC) family protein
MTVNAGFLVTRLLIAAALTAMIGLEREYHRKPAGLRTNMLIGIGSALFTILSITFAQEGQGSADRVAAQIATGIGFLGAGAILRSEHSVHGLTTAATIWVNAAIGMAVGAGAYALAVATTAVTLVVLAVLPPIEAFFERWAKSRGESGSRP